MTEAFAANSPSRLARRYTLLEKLGVGGQGEVWRARDEARGGDIALKLLSSSLAGSEAAWAQFEREHRIASRLEHPGILKVHAPQREGDFAVLPMDLAPAGDLRRLRGSNYLEIIPVLIEIAEALEHAHERGVIHRDLKPGNVLFGHDGRALIADFGIAEIPEAALRESTKPALSPFTASPQQLRGEPPSITDDIYGLGALAYELLSGYPPYYPRFDIRRVLEEPVPDLRTPQPVPPQLVILVMRMLAKRAEDRPQSMREVIDVLDSALNDTLTFEFDRVQMARKPPAQPAQPAPPPQQRRPVQPLHPAGAQEAPMWTPPPSAAVPPPQPPPPPPPPPRAAVSAARPSGPWDDLHFEVKPRLMRLEPEPARRWPWVVLGVLALLAFGVFFWLPRYAPPEWMAAISGVAQSLKTSQPERQVTAATPPIPEAGSAPEGAPPAVAATAPAEKEVVAGSPSDDKYSRAQGQFKQKLASLEERAAGVWGGAEFASAKARAAEAIGAFDAGNTQIATQRLRDALALLAKVERKAPEALEAQLAEGDRAFAAGQPEVAKQAYEMAQRIDPNSDKAAAALQRVGSLGGVLPLLADARNAEASKDYARAVQDYSQALSLDPNNADARAGLNRAHAAFGEDSYAKAVGAGYAALGAGRLEDARASFEKARDMRPNAPEATSGLARVGAALGARGFAYTRQRAAALEGEERWSEALTEYESALRIDPSLAFAQQGKVRTAERAQLASALQALIDEPERLAAPSVRDEADALIDKAQSMAGSGPVLRSQVARLQILLPEFDKPVRLELVSDNATQVAIQRVGEFGSFTRREIELKPGKYTVVGRRSGFRDVRRDVTIAPGNDQMQTISVSCVEPI